MSRDDTPHLLQEVSVKTFNDLHTVASTVRFRQLSSLPLPEIEHLADEVARVVPAGNVPAMILNGLANVKSRRVSARDSRRHIDLLFRGVRHSLDEVVYATFFAGPAAVLYAYQQLLRLAGKDLASAFPDGTWQFYLEFALREDSARHSNETTGFHLALAHSDAALDESDQLAAWVLATAGFLRQMPNVLANEWYEPVALKLLAKAAAASGTVNPSSYQELSQAWTNHRPYRRAEDAASDDFPAYRRRIFESFIDTPLSALPDSAQKTFRAELKQAQQSDQPAYQQQLSWLAYLDPGTHSETRVPYPPEEAAIGVIWQGRYYLLPLPDLVDPSHVRAVVRAILEQPPAHPPAALDDVLVTARRAEQGALRQGLDAATRQEVERLRRAPVLLNWDKRDAAAPLATVRQGKRGLGDHALTLFRTADSIVMDQSHIFFDGSWGAAVAEILTNEAVAWAAALAGQPAPPAGARPYSPRLVAPASVASQAQRAAIRPEASAESTAIKLKAILTLRRMLKQRSDLAQVTVNDLLILYRGLHAQRYRPSPGLKKALEALAADPHPNARQAYRLIEDALAQMRDKNPAILIPVDARRYDPRERVFPTSFRNPFTDFLDHHRQTLKTLKAFQASGGDQTHVTFHDFFEAQLYYLRLIGGFGELLSRYKDIALEGQSTSTATIRLLGHLPERLQGLLNSLPTRFEVLNEVIKGEEVFSNVGRVAKGSSLRRFISAKDDNEQKTLIWGVLTDDQGVMHLSLRDFRPYVEALHKLGRVDLAQLIVQDYVDAYATGLNLYVRELHEITVASRDTLKFQQEAAAAIAAREARREQENARAMEAARAQEAAPRPARPAEQPARRFPLRLLPILLIALVALMIAAAVWTSAPGWAVGGAPTAAPSFWLPVEFVYNDDAFYWVNRSDRRLTAGPIVFEQIGGPDRFEGRRWIYQTLEPYTCMEIVFIDVEEPPRPNGCRPSATFVLARGEAKKFWGGSEQFRVLWDGQTIAVCDSAAGHCQAAVPPQ